MSVQDEINEFNAKRNSQTNVNVNSAMGNLANALQMLVDETADEKLVKIYNTVADMQEDSANITEGMIAEVLGYYTKGDGGGHKRKKNPTGSSYEWEILSVKELGYADIRWYGCNESLTAVENTALIQRVLLERVIKIPFGNFKLNEININTNCVQIIGEYSEYSSSILEYQGNGTFITFGLNAGYPKVKGICFSGITDLATDFYRTGTTLIDYSIGNTSIEFEDCRFKNSEVLLKQNYNGFYNKFINCRFEKFKIGLNKFNGNNLNIEKCRALNFNEFLVCNNYFGSTNLKNNSFEVFNGNIVIFTGQEQGTFNFEGNYVEDYHTVELPTNFPRSLGQYPNRFGGNNLFTGPVGIANILGNSLDIGGSFAIAYFSTCSSLISTGNKIHGYATNNGLGRLYNVYDTTNLEHVCINDVSSLVGSGDFTSITYNQPIFEGKNPYVFYEFYDCISKKEIYNPKTLIVPTLKNGWTLGALGSNNPLTVKYMKDGIYFQGVVNGTAKTDNIILETNPTITKKFKNNNTEKQFVHKYFTTLNSSNEVVIIRYLESIGGLRLENSPTNLTNIFLEFFIPYNN